MREFLIVKPSSLGDIIYSLPVAQSIREQCPDAVISWIVKDRFAEIVDRCPTVNGDVIRFQHHRGLKGPIGLLQTLREIRRKKYDAVLDLQGLLRSGIMTRATRSPLRIGSEFAREGGRWLCNRIVPLPAAGSDAHIVEKLLQFLPALGLKAELRSPIAIRGESPEEVDSRLKGCRPIVLFPNSRCEKREWKGFPELTQRIIASVPDAVVVWDSHKRWPDADVSDPQRFINLTSKTSLLHVVELIDRARLVVSNDSGPLHMAAAFGIPTLGLHGPTYPKHTGPYPLDRPSNNFLEAPERDLSRLAIDVVVDRVMAILDQQQHDQAA